MNKLAVAFVLLLLPLGCNRGGAVVLNGRVEAYLSDLAPRTGGTIAAIPVHEGQRVKAGDLLVRINAEEMTAAVSRDSFGLESAQAKNLAMVNGSRLEDIAQGAARVKDAEAALALAEDTLARATRLTGERIMAQADLDRARADRDRAAAALALQRQALAELKAGARAEDRQGALADARRAKAVLEGTQAQASFLEVRAPFDGVVVHRLREVGSVVNAGQAVVTLAPLDRLWVRVYIPQPLQPRLAQGMPLQIVTQDGRTFDAALDEVSSEYEYTPKMVETAEERVNLVYPAQVRLPQGWDKGLLPGTSVTVRITPRAGK